MVPGKRMFRGATQWDFGSATGFILSVMVTINKLMRAFKKLHQYYRERY